MRIELVCIGTELLTGKPNTNTAYLGEKLSAIGLDLSLVTTVGDNRKELEKVFREALERSDMVLATGGLGPTFDDVTREALARVLGRRLVLDRATLAAVARRFLARNIEMPKNNESQAYIIEGARVLPNRLGTAPGQIIEIERERRPLVIVLLPGPPREMQTMFEADAFPYLKKYETGIKKGFVLRLFGISESAADEKIRSIVEAEKKLESGTVDFTILASPGGIDIRASVRGSDELLVDETIATLKHEFHEVLGGHIYGEGRQTLEGAVGALLARRHKTLSVAESCTGGLLAQRITDIPGSSLYFTQGVVTYSNESKTRLLGVRRESLEQHGAVSAPVAREMAEGMRKNAASGYALSVTGIAGPGGGTPEKPVGLVFIGLATGTGTTVSEFRFGGNRHDIRERSASHAFDLLRRELLREEAPAEKQRRKRGKVSR